MANQFDAKVRFDPIAWRAIDRETQLVATVIDNYPNVRWSVSFAGRIVERGEARNPRAARAKCRRVIEKERAKRKAEEG